MTASQGSDIADVLLTMHTENLQETESYRLLWEFYEKWVRPNIGKLKEEIELIEKSKEVQK